MKLNGHTKKRLTNRATSVGEAMPAAGNAITPQRVAQSRLQRFNPIRTLTPELLGLQLEQMARGYLSPIMRTWEAMERRDDRMAAVAPKAKSALARHGYEIVTLEDSTEAQRHKEALEYFYANLTVVDAYEEDNQGKFSKLVRTMANAIGMKYAAHEIAWEPSPSGLTATFRYAPPWFFENITGRLRFLSQDANFYGVEMNPEEWLITAGDGFGIDEACSVAYMFKHLPLKDWLAFSEKFGFPGVLGKTNAAKGSDQWNAMVEAVSAFANDFAGVCSLQDTIELVQASGGSGTLPFEPIIEKMDQGMTILWRGADLSTQSHGGGGEGTGASLQSDETQNLDQDRAQTISEVLQIQVDRRVVRFTFGVDQPLARIQLKTAPKDTALRDLKMLETLVPLGVPFAVNDVLQRLGWTTPKAGEVLLTAPVAAPTPFGRQEGGKGTEMGNARQRKAAAMESIERDPEYKKFLGKCRLLLAKATAEDLRPLRAALANVLEGDEAELPARMKALSGNLGTLAKPIISATAAAKQLEEILGATMASQLSNQE